ncbi:MAG: shikimate kinase [Litorimonas sp.]
MPREHKGGIPQRPIALVGLMGVGKTTIGRRLATRLDREFYDSDDEIEKASGRTVAGYFNDHGQDAFRSGEGRVIERLLAYPNIVLATGGGAFTHESTRQVLNQKALTIWLQGDFETLMERVSRNDKRPLLQVEDPRAKMRELMTTRNPLYRQAHIHVKIARGPHIRTVNRVLKAIRAHKTPETL